MPLICFASPKGGVGKSMLAANVAGQLLRSGVRQVIALDLDPQNTLRLHFGISLGQRDGIMRRLESPSEWRDVVLPSRAGVLVMPYGATSFDAILAQHATLAAHPEYLSAPLRQLAKDPTTAVVVDTVPGPSTPLAAILPAVDMLITVLSADAASLALIADVKTCACYGLPARATPDGSTLQHRVIFNQFDPISRMSASLLNGAVAGLSKELLGIVHRDEYVAEALVAQQLVSDYAPFSRASADLQVIAQQIALSLKLVK